MKNVEFLWRINQFKLHLLSQFSLHRLMNMSPLCCNVYGDEYRWGFHTDLYCKLNWVLVVMIWWHCRINASEDVYEVFNLKTFLWLLQYCCKGIFQHQTTKCWKTFPLLTVISFSFLYFVCFQTVTFSMIEAQALLKISIAVSSQFIWYMLWRDWSR